MTPEQRARSAIDALLTAAGWAVQDVRSADRHAARGVALREFELNPGHGTADYLLYVGGKAAGLIEAKREGATLTGVEVQSGKYAQGLPSSLPAWRRPLPFIYESTGAETHFTNGLDPEPRARNVFAFHRPETLADWLGQLPSPASAGEGPGVSNCVPSQAGFMCFSGFHGVLSRSMAFRMTSNLRMQATMATFFGLPASMSF
jgi:type I restriction enzyme R subunit